MSIAVFDIDGVVADVRHRLPYLERHPKQWDRFFTAASGDDLLSAGVELVREHEQAGDDVVWLTGRPDWLRPITVEWLTRFGLPAGELSMRPNRDYRPARYLKLETLKTWSAREITIFVDDDPDVVRTAAGAGFPAILATWVPHEKTLQSAQERLGRT